MGQFVLKLIVIRTLACSVVSNLGNDVELLRGLVDLGSLSTSSTLDFARSLRPLCRADSKFDECHEWTAWGASVKGRIGDMD